jgi:uncharacterized protein (DUF2062 family)/SAM-dependent methyltransferase
MTGVRARIRATARALLAAHASPGRLAAAMVVGAIVGCTPLFGLHLPLCIALAAVFRLNVPAVYAAANVSIPPTAPLLGFASVQLGERLLRGRWLPLTVDEFRHPAGGAWSFALRFLGDWFVGGVLLGVALGALLGAVVYVAARARQRRGPLPPADPIEEAIAAASDRYRAAPRPMRWYAFFKYRMDPCYRRLAALVPDGAHVVDLGTGLGMLPLVLRLLPGERRLLGVDWDGAKLDAGRLATAGLDGIELTHGDVRAFSIPPCDAVTLVDVLHYYAPEAQRALLARAAAALRPGGRLLVRDGDARRGRGRWTRALEAIAVRLGWNRGDGTTLFRPAGELAADLAALGLEVAVEPLAGRLHPGNVLICATRR